MVLDNLALGVSGQAIILNKSLFLAHILVCLWEAVWKRYMSALVCVCVCLRLHVRVFVCAVCAAVCSGLSELQSRVAIIL